MLVLNNNSKIKQIYELLADQIVSSYKQMAKNSTFRMDKNEILISFDAYIQSILIKTVLHKRSFEAGEVNYIKNLVRYSDHFNNIGVMKDVYPSKDVEEALYIESSKVIKTIPTFATFSILIDKEIENSIIKSKETFSMSIIKMFQEIIELVLDDSEDEYSKKLLRTLNNFFIDNHSLN